MAVIKEKALTLAGILCPPSLYFDKYSLNLRVGSFDRPVQSGNGDFNIRCQNGVHKIDTDINESEVRSHLHGQNFINSFDFFARIRNFPYSLNDLLIGTFSNQKALGLGCEEDGRSTKYHPDDDCG